MEELICNIIQDMEKTNAFTMQEISVVKNVLSEEFSQYDVIPKTRAVVKYKELPPIAKQFLLYKKIDGLSENTIKQYTKYLTFFFAYINAEIEDITSQDIRLYLYHIQETKNVSGTTMGVYYNTLGSFFTWCINEGILQHNPMLNIKPCARDTAPRQPLSELEVEQIRNVCDNLRDKAMIELFISTGCRASEVVNCTINDVNFLTNTVTVTGKGNKTREVYLSPRAKLTLQEYLTSRTDNNPSLFVYLRNPFTSLEYAGIRTVVKNLGKKAGIKRNVFPHLLRHTTATLALKRGMNITSIQKMLGHDKLSTTMIYASVNQDAVKSEHEKYVF